jgi:hypothetical protein
MKAQTIKLVVCQSTSKHWLCCFLLAGFALCFNGCANRYPMGLGKEQWEALAPEKQAEFQAQQYAIDAQQRAAAAAQEQAREQEQQARIAAEKERIEKLYAAARYGDIVKVVIQGGAMEIYGKRKPIRPAAFDIAKGEGKRIRIKTAGASQQTVDFLVYLSEDANTLTFDAGYSDAFIMVNTDWESGQSYVTPALSRKGRIMLPGTTFFVKFKNLPGAPERLIIERH